MKQNEVLDWNTYLKAAEGMATPVPDNVSVIEHTLNICDSVNCPIDRGIFIWIIFIALCQTPRSYLSSTDVSAEVAKRSDLICSSVVDYLFRNRPHFAISGWYSSPDIAIHISSDDPGDPITRAHFAHTLMDTLKSANAIGVKGHHIDKLERLFLYVASKGHPEAQRFVAASIRGSMHVWKQTLAIHEIRLSDDTFTEFE